MLKLDVRLDGFDQVIGELHQRENDAPTFNYTKAHLDNPRAIPLSLSLPLTDTPYDDVVTRPFFDNLLQERDGALQQVMEREGLRRADIVGLLHHLGRDCAGAISVLPHGAPPVKVPGDLKRDYRPLSPERMAQLVASLHQRQPLPEGMADPSPLAGVQSKIALTLLPDGSFAEPLPGSGAPTTHILKAPDRNHPRDPRLEHAAMELLRKSGEVVASTKVLAIAGLEMLLITRFDRFPNSEGKIARLHQEDFAQALGLPARLKYQRNGKPGRRFDASAIRRVLDSTLNPASTREQFISAVLFDLMIGNVDGHAKNFALLYAPEGGSILSPRYDVLPTRLDANLTDELSFSIGSATTLNEITAQDFGVFLGQMGVMSQAAQRRLRDGLTLRIATFLAGERDRLTRAGLKDFADLAAANIRTLLPEFGLPVPERAANADAFFARASGWSVGS